MRVLLTGAGSNIGTGVTALLRRGGHDVVLSDVGPLPDLEQFAGCDFHQIDVT